MSDDEWMTHIISAAILEGVAVIYPLQVDPFCSGRLDQQDKDYGTSAGYPCQLQFHFYGRN